MRRCHGVMILAVLGPAVMAWAWGERGHTVVTEAALELLADDMPAFLKTESARAWMVHLSSEPDRWRNLKLPPMGHINKPEHYFDVDLLPLYGLTAQTLPKYRHDYIAAMVLYKARHPDKDYGYNAARDREHSREWPGLAPYRICELYVQLKSSWRTLNTYQKYPEVAGEQTIDACRRNVIYLMGMMNHYVADTAQPLHTTKHHHGWVGENPKGYTTEHGFHGFIDTGIIEVAQIDHRALLKLKPAKRIIDDQRLFEEVMEHILESFREVEPIYELERQGAFQPELPHFPEGVKFVQQRLRSAAVMLNALWESAYRNAGIDEFREAILRRQARERATKEATPGPRAHETTKVQ